MSSLPLYKLTYTVTLTQSWLSILNSAENWTVVLLRFETGNLSSPKHPEHHHLHIHLLYLCHYSPSHTLLSSFLAFTQLPLCFCHSLSLSFSHTHRFAPLTPNIHTVLPVLLKYIGLIKTRVWSLLQGSSGISSTWKIFEFLCFRSFEIIPFGKCLQMMSPVRLKAQQEKREIDPLPSWCWCCE